MPNLEAIELALAVKRGLIPASESGSKKSDLDLLNELSSSDRESIRKSAEALLSDHAASVDAAISSLDLDRDTTKQHDSNERDEAASHLNKNNQVTTDFDSAGEVIEGDRYKILRECGHGGLGVVFTARDQQLNRIVALKKLHPHLGSSSGAVERFEAEAEITGELQHPAIAPIYSLGTSNDGAPFYTMRFIEGKSLADRLKQEGGSRRDFDSFEFRQLISTFNQVTRAVDFSHNKQIIHRDIKPANIMLGDYGETFLVDWGLAKSIEQRDHPTDANFENDSTLTLHPNEKQPNKLNRTRAGDVVGTPAFMSPEQARGEIGLTQATDIYGLGATLFTILTGCTPFAKTDANMTLAKLRAGEIPVASDVNSEVPNELNAICRKAMHAKPTERYSTANELREDLERWLSDEPVSTLKESIGSRLRRSVRKRFALVASIVIGSVACLILVAAGWMITSGQNRELNKLNQQLTVSEQAAKESKQLADLNFQHAQDLVGEFFVDVAEAPALKNGRSDSEKLRQDLLEKAQKYYEAFIAENAANDNTRLQLIYAQEKLANISREFGQFSKCEQICIEALSRVPLLDQAVSPKERAVVVASLHQIRGVSLKYLGRIDESIESLKLAIKTQQEIVDQGLADPLMIRNLSRNKGSLATALLEQGNLKKADQLISESTETVKGLADPNETLVADQIDFLMSKLQGAQVKSELDQTEEAIALLRSGIERSQRLVDLNPDNGKFLDLHACLTQDLSSNLDETIESKKWLTIAIKYRKKLIDAGKSDFTNQLYLSSAYRSFASLEADEGNYNEAEKLVSHSISILQGLFGKEDKNAEVQDRLANSFKTKGDILSANSNYEAASKAYQNATDSMGELLRSEKGGRPRYRHALAQVLNNHANLLLDLREVKQAAEKYRRAAEMIEEIYRSSDSPSAAVLRDCIIILNGHGRMVGKTLTGGEGEAIMRRRVEYAKQLFDKTKNPNDGQRWAWSINDLASVLTNHSKAESNLKSACDCFKESREAWESLPASYQKTDKFAHGLGGTLVNGSDAFKLIEDFETAIKWLDEADALMGPIARRKNPHPVVKQFHGIGLRSRARLQTEIALKKYKVSEDPTELEEAIKLLDEASDYYDGKNVPLLELKADVYLKLGNEFSAVEALNSALEHAVESKFIEIENRIKDILNKR